MNIFKKAIVEYRYSRRFKKTSKISSIKYAIKHMFDKDRDFADLIKAIDKAADKIRENSRNGQSNYCIVTKNFADENKKFMDVYGSEIEYLPIGYNTRNIIGHCDHDHNKTLTDIRMDVENKRINGKIDY